MSRFVVHFTLIAALLITFDAPPVRAAAPSVEPAVAAAALARGIPSGTITTVRVYSAYATAVLQIGDTAATVYLHKTSAGWQALHLVGGVASAAQVHAYGVPQSVVSHLKSGAGTQNYAVHWVFRSASLRSTGVRAPSRGVRAVWGLSATPTANESALRDVCQSYLRQLRTGSLTVVAAQQVGAYAICHVVGLEGGGEVLLRNGGKSWNGVAFTQGVFGSDQLVKRYHVPLSVARQLR